MFNFNFIVLEKNDNLFIIANRARGGGYESHDSYEEHGGTTFIERIFCDIDSIHVMRDSLAKVIEALNNPNKKGEKKWFELLDDSKWMQHLRFERIK